MSRPISPAGPCNQVWPGGLKYNILTECVKTTRHYKHQNAEGNLLWHGAHLTEAEEELRDELREQNRGSH